MGEVIKLASKLEEIKPLFQETKVKVKSSIVPTNTRINTFPLTSSIMGDKP